MTPKRSLYFGKIFGLEMRSALSSLFTAIFAIGTLFLLLNRVFKWRPLTAVAGGILATLIHFFSELWHQIGHARAAEQAGYPMKGVTFVGPLGVSVYPKNEGILPAETHIQRALGGPVFSFLLTLGMGMAAILLRYVGGLPFFLAVFSFLDNLLVFTIGALLPLDFTDGGTLLTWWGQRKSGRLLL
jgi:hypothetical protein